MAFCISNASKSGIRFFAFDTARKFIRTDASGKATPLGNMSAGMIAGVVESVVVVTPGETLKTKIIDDRTGPKLYRSASHAVRMIVATEGLQGLYRGVVPVTLKQSANAMVRFTDLFLDYLKSLSLRYSQLQPVTTVVAGAMAGAVTVYATMPFDTIKTRLQAIDGLQRYKGSLDCMRSVVVNEGVSALRKGTTPRLMRLSVCNTPPPGLPPLTVRLMIDEDKSG
ncbi:hypothetical protein VTN77DRAFT_1038 [Rasamsonia byssochlamydoides]|uniref:uncharacterized protein n=1 Tax=Rasamsonia byssochlamydoides TaxID=89139 RepID=UPI00374435BB